MSRSFRGRWIEVGGKERTVRRSSQVSSLLVELASQEEEEPRAQIEPIWRKKGEQAPRRNQEGPPVAQGHKSPTQQAARQHSTRTEGGREKNNPCHLAGREIKVSRTLCSAKMSRTGKKLNKDIPASRSEALQRGECRPAIRTL